MERSILINFYDASNGKEWHFNQHWCSERPLSDWYGVETNSENEIIGLCLDNNNLHGELTESIGDLKNLTILKLGNISTGFSATRNKFCGEVPLKIIELIARIRSNENSVSLGNLCYSSKLQLPQNLGAIDLGIIKLDLSDCSLSGHIPSSIANARHLEFLSLHNNRLIGPIPTALGALTGLQTLLLHKNHLAAEIPSIFGDMKSLQRLSLNDNEFSGLVPSQLWILQDRGCIVDLSENPDLRMDFVNTRALRSPWDRFILIAHVAIGYVDLVTDFFVIAALCNEGQRNLMGLNIFFVAAHTFLYLLQSTNARDMVVVVFQLKPLLEGLRSLRDGKQTICFSLLKKIDAVSRSMPSAILQFFLALQLLDNPRSLYSTTILLSFRFSTVSIYIASATAGILGTAFTLAANVPVNESTIISTTFFKCLMLFISEGSFRILTFAIVFIALNSWGFLILGLDFVFRVAVGHCSHAMRAPSYKDSNRSSIQRWSEIVSSAIISMGTIFSPDKPMLMFGLLMATLEGLVAVLLLGFADTCHFLRSSQISKTPLTVATLVAFFLVFTCLLSTQLIHFLADDDDTDPYNPRTYRPTQAEAQNEILAWHADFKSLEQRFQGVEDVLGFEADSNLDMLGHSSHETGAGGKATVLTSVETPLISGDSDEFH